MPRMITIKQASIETGLAYERIRQLCLTKQIVFIKAGNKYLINAEKLADFLNGDLCKGVE